jgi:hypothetical protein
MNDLKRLFSNSLTAYNRIIEFLKKYAKEVNRLIISTDPKRYEEVVAILDQLESLTALEFASEDKYDLINTVYNKFSKIEELISSLFNILFTKDNIAYRNSLLSENSAILEDIERRRMIEYLGEIKEKNESNDKIAFAGFDNVKESLQFIIKVEKSDNELQTLNRFILYLLNDVMKDKSVFNKDLVKTIVEKYKNIELGVQTIVQTEFPYLSRAYLTPVDRFATGNIDRIIDGIIDSRKVNLFIMYISSSHPMEFTLDPLTNIDYIEKNKLYVSDKTGLNDTFIKKSETIIEFDNARDRNTQNNTTREDNTWKIAINETNPNNKWMVMEVYNNTHYRFLSKTANKLANKKEKHLFDNAMNRDEISSLFTLPMRPREYGLKTYRDPFDINMKQTLDEYKTRQEITYSSLAIKQMLQQTLYDMLRTQITDKIPKISEFRRLVISEDVIMKAIEKFLMNGVSKPNCSKYQYMEIYLAKYEEIYHMSSFIIKRLRKSLYIVDIDEKIYTEYEDKDIIDYYEKVLVSTIESILENMDTLKLFKENTSMMQFMITRNDLI